MYLRLGNHKFSGDILATLNLSDKRKFEICQIADEFRRTWERKIQNKCLAELGIPVWGRGDLSKRKKIYIVGQGASYVAEFNKQRERAERKIVRLLGSSQRPKGSWLPTVVPNCVSIRASTIAASSTKPVTLEQADWFARRAGKRLPRAAEDLVFYKISKTGYRYILYATSLDSGAKRYPATNWSVVQMPNHFALSDIAVKTQWNTLDRELQSIGSQLCHKSGRFIATNGSSSVALYCKPK